MTADDSYVTTRDYSTSPFAVMMSLRG